jgi:pimeloyl-ACP methyl ester carboxylesterase
MNMTTTPATIPGVQHHRIDVNGTTLHYVSAGQAGDAGRAEPVGASTANPPILLVHGFPETWWAFHSLIPLLSKSHRVFAVDLRGFGDSGVAPDDFDSATAAEDLHQLIRGLDVGPVHLVAQDISGGSAFRLAATHPVDVASFTAIEMGLAGFGLEGLADVTHGGSWHVGVLAAPGIADLLFAGREREILAQWAFPSMMAIADAVSETDLDEFVRTYSRPGGWAGAVGLYRSMLAEGEAITALAASAPLTMPTLAVGGFGGSFTAATLSRVTEGAVASVQIDGVGHYVAMEDPEGLAEAIVNFLASVDS